MTRFPSPFRPLPRVTPGRGSGVGRRERAAEALVGGAQLLLVCGYAFLIALVWSAVLGPAP